MAEDLELRLTLDDEASKGIDAVTGKAKAATAKPYDIDLRVGKDAESDLKRIAAQIQATAKNVQELGQKRVTFRVDQSQLKTFQKALGDVKQDVQKIDGETIHVSVDSKDLDTVATRLQGVKEGTHEVGRAAESSKSALANMVGNTAQDLGALSGVAGSAGVAVGQLAEYFADATLAGEGFGAVAGSFASVALPIAALAVAVPLITNAFFGMTAAEKLAKDTAEELTKAFHELDSASADVRFDEVIKNVKEFLKGSDTATQNITDLGIGAGDLANVMTGGTAPAIDRVRTELKGYETQLASATQAEEDAQQVRGDAIDVSLASAEAERKVAAANGLTVDELRDRMSQETDTLSAIDAKTAGTQKAETADDRYRKALEDLNRIEAKRKGDLDAITHAQEAQATQSAALVAGLTAQEEAAKAYAATVHDLQGQLLTLSTMFGETAVRVTAAGNAWGFVTDLDEKARQSLIDVADGVDTLTEGFKKNGATLDIHNAKGRDNIKNAQGLRKAYGEAFQQTLQDTNGDLNAATIRILGLTQEFDKQAKAAGLSQKQIAEYHHELGLTPEQVETTIKLTKDDEARQKLGLLQGVIAGLPRDIQAQISADIAQGKFQEALAVLGSLQVDPKTGKVREAPIDPTVPTDEAAAAQATIAAVTNNDGAGYAATVKVNADTTAAELAIAGLTDDISRMQSLLSGHLMSGGDTGAGGIFRVGEAGPETVVLPGGAHVYTAGQTMTRASHAGSGGGGGGTTIFMTVNVPAAANPAEVGGHIVKAIAAFERRSGKGWRAA